jgi:serine/threonine protein kinase
LDKAVGVGSDIWAFGCTLFEIRTGRKLFGTFDDEPDEHLWKVAMILGKLPEPWWSTTWEARERIFQDDIDGDGRVVQIRTESQQALIDEEEAKNAVVWQAPEPRSIMDAIKRGFFIEYSDRPGGFHQDISQEESQVFSDLLERILRWKPEEHLQLVR